jgi:hypothetical protein
VARYRRVFRAELLGCGRERPRPSNCEKVSKIVPILAWLFVSHRPLLINPHPFGTCRPSLTKMRSLTELMLMMVPELPTRHILNERLGIKLAHYKRNAIP